MNDLDNIGVVIKIDTDEAIAMTDDSIFIRIRKKEDMFLGQKILIKKEDLLKEKMKNFKSFYYAAAGFAAVFAIVFTLMFLHGRSFNMGLTYAYIDIDINPSIELMIDEKEVVRDVHTLNKDAENLISQLKLENLKIDQALNIIIEKSKENGYLDFGSESGYVFIAAALGENHANSGEDKKQLADLLQNIKKDLNEKYGDDIKSKVVNVPLDYRNKSKANNISMGKYFIYAKAKEMSKEISMEELKEAELYTLLKKIDMLTGKGNTPVPSMATSTPVAVQVSETANIIDTPTPQIANTPIPVTITGVTSSKTHTMLYTSTPYSKSVTATPQKYVNDSPSDVVKIEEARIPGLKGEYYDNSDFTELKVIRTDSQVNFRWAEGCPDSQIGADTFSVRWTGKIVPRYSENYTFYTYADDGVRLWINNVLLIDNWKSQRPSECKGELKLNKGTQYDIKVEYFENIKSGQVKLYWSSSSQAKEIIPESQLYHNVKVYQAEQASLSKAFIESSNKGFAGSGYVNYQNEVGGWIEWKIEVAKSGTYKLNLRYANGTNANRVVEINVNDNTVKNTLDFEKTNAWTTWKDKSIMVNLKAGVNTIRVTAISSEGGPNIDYLELNQ